MQDAKEEIRERLAVEDVVGQYVELKRAGRNLKGRSPWGVDKTPSFMVSPEKGIWHDFSANKGGDIFTFVMEVEGITFREALEKLAGQAGVELARYGGEGEVAGKKKRMRECLQLAMKYFQVALTKNKSVMEYVFYRRNLNRKTVGEFGIGYAPNGGRVVREFLASRGFTDGEMAEAGLLNRFGGDLFKGRMMVPLSDGMGGVVGFTGRILNDKDKDSPKYLNTPETLLYNKGRQVFGLAQAKEAIRKSGYAVIVEGNMDVISSHQAGVKEAVATAGTAMTEMHLKSLARLTDDIRLAYDGDAAGVAAAERAIGIAAKVGVNLSVVSDYGGAKDPDELIQRGPELWQRAVGECVPAVDWLLGKYEEKLDLRTGRGKKEYSSVAVRLIGHLGDPVEREHYEEIVAERLGVSLEALRNKDIGGEVRRLKPVRKRVEGDSAAGSDDGDGDDSSREDEVSVAEKNLAAIAVVGGVEVDEELICSTIDKNELGLIFEYRYADWTRENLAEEAKELAKKIETEKLQKQKAELMGAMMEAEDREDDKEAERLMGEIDKLNKGKRF